MGLKYVLGRLELVMSIDIGMLAQYLFFSKFDSSKGWGMQNSFLEYE